MIRFITMFERFTRVSSSKNNFSRRNCTTASTFTIGLLYMMCHLCFLRLLACFFVGYFHLSWDV